MLQQMQEGTRMTRLRAVLHERFPLAVQYLFQRDIRTISFWVALVVFIPSLLYYAIGHHMIPDLLRWFLAQSPEDQQAYLAALDALRMPSWGTLIARALLLALPILIACFVLRLTQDGAQLSRPAHPLPHTK